MEIKPFNEQARSTFTAPGDAKGACGPCCSQSCASQAASGAVASSVAATPAALSTAPQSGLVHFRIANMDCASEESEIRRALEPVAGVERLQFQLSARTLGLQTSDTGLLTPTEN